MKLEFCPTTIFRETPKVTFFDSSIKSTNGCDVVMHSGEAISPPDEFEYEQYYVHNHQIDHNLVITCLLYTSPSPRDLSTSRMPSSA